jgi:hypothetical protein
MMNDLRKVGGTWDWVLMSVISSIKGRKKDINGSLE